MGATMAGRVVVGIEACRLSQVEAELVGHPAVAGVILLERNYEIYQKEQLKKLLMDIHRAALDSGKKNSIPVLIDQEGGHVQRLGRGFSAIPAAYALGTCYDLQKETGLEFSYQVGRRMAAELKEYAITSLAPVLDLDAGSPIITGLGRAFHKDPNSCSDIARAYIKGMNSVNMQAVGKHFPGHGRLSVDSHISESRDPRTLQELEQSDLIPFQKLIQENLLAAIMPAHTVFPAVDDAIVCRSKVWLEDILRERYGFKGATITDCLSMVGAGNATYEEKISTSLEYCDLALACNLPAIEMLQVLNNVNYKKLTLVQEQRIQRWLDCDIAARLNLIREIYELHTD